MRFVGLIQCVIYYKTNIANLAFHLAIFLHRFRRALHIAGIVQEISAVFGRHDILTQSVIPLSTGIHLFFCKLLAALESEEDKRRFTKLYEENHVRAEQTALRILRDPHDAEDAVQNAFLQVIHHFDEISGIPCKKLGFWIIGDSSACFDGILYPFWELAIMTPLSRSFPIIRILNAWSFMFLSSVLAN